MERAVRVQRGNRVGRDRVLGHHVHGDFHAVLPVLHLTSIDLLLKFSLIQFSKPNGDFQFEVGILAQLVVGQVVVAGDDHAGLGLGNRNALRLLIGGDVGGKRG